MGTRGVLVRTGLPATMLFRLRLLAGLESVTPKLVRHGDTYTLLIGMEEH